MYQSHGSYGCAVYHVIVIWAWLLMLILICLLFFHVFLSFLQDFIHAGWCRISAIYCSSCMKINLTFLGSFERPHPCGIWMSLEVFQWLVLKSLKLRAQLTNSGTDHPSMYSRDYTFIRRNSACSRWYVWKIHVVSCWFASDWTDWHRTSLPLMLSELSTPLMPPLSFVSVFSDLWFEGACLLGWRLDIVKWWKMFFFKKSCK